MEASNSFLGSFSYFIFHISFFIFHFSFFIFHFTFSFFISIFHFSFSFSFSLGRISNVRIGVRVHIASADRRSNERTSVNHWNDDHVPLRNLPLRFNSLSLLPAPLHKHSNFLSLNQASSSRVYISPLLSPAVHKDSKADDKLDLVFVVD